MKAAIYIFLCIIMPFSAFSQSVGKFVYEGGYVTGELTLKLDQTFIWKVNDCLVTELASGTYASDGDNIILKPDKAYSFLGSIDYGLFSNRAIDECCGVQLDYSTATSAGDSTVISQDLIDKIDYCILTSMDCVYSSNTNLKNLRSMASEFVFPWSHLKKKGRTVVLLDESGKETDWVLEKRK